MAKFEVLTKAELYRRMDLLHADPMPPMSLRFIAELAGLSHDLVYRVFVMKTMPMTEHTQVAMSKALDRMLRGEVRVMRRRDNSRFLDYKNEPRPRLRRHFGLAFDGDRIRVTTGVRNRADYSHPTLAETFRSK